MTVSHHLSDETLQDYSAGTLSSAMETVVACHLTICPLCRAKASIADAVGGWAVDTGSHTSVSMSAAELLRSAAGKHESKAEAPPALVRGVPAPLGRLLPAPLDELDWRKVAPGIRQFNLSTQHRRYGAFKLLHLAPGVVLSQHTHNDSELTYVVRGSYQDEIGRFRAGDIADMDGNDIHQPVVDTEEPCIALIATHSPVRFSGMLGRMMQPFVGI